ncbi:MAG: hypothetical protein JO189_09775 [Deltaproteobacteria bacterium]|nr:hypothetical protein [Deltaproteobacteria bacterium]
MLTEPLLDFAPRLIALRQAGLLRYGVLASRYTQLFEMKRVESTQATDERILETEDIQSLSSLGDSDEMIRRIKVIPLVRHDFIAIKLPTVISALLLVLIAMPLKAIMSHLLRLLV